MVTTNSIGILSGLVLEKPLGVFLFSFFAVKTGIGKLSEDLKWKHVLGIGVLAGIGFTIDLGKLTDIHDPLLVDQSKMTVLTASVLAAIVAAVYVRWIG